MFDKVKERIKKHEGFRNKIYLDSLGKATIGYGHLITKKDNFIQGKEYSKQELDELFEKDFKAYFDALIENPIIVASNAETHPATKCFKDTYLTSTGVKSMLDVPIWFRGKIGRAHV